MNKDEAKSVLQSAVSIADKAKENFKEGETMVGLTRLAMVRGMLAALLPPPESEEKPDPLQTSDLTPDTTNPASRELVTQEDRSGCGIACVAMLSGRTYQQVRTVFLESGDREDKELRLRAVGNGAGITPGEMFDLMRCFEIDPHVPVVGPVAFSAKTKFGRHLVVIDEHGKIHDPDTPAPAEKSDKDFPCTGQESE
jgi:hypothetical protein